MKTVRNGTIYSISLRKPLLRNQIGTRQRLGVEGRDQVGRGVIALRLVATREACCQAGIGWQGACLRKLHLASVEVKRLWWQHGRQCILQHGKQFVPG